jgi:hypothetical protein
MQILVVDLGGSHIKCLLTGHKEPRKFESGPEMTPHEMVKGVLAITKRWHFDVVSVGYPGESPRDCDCHADLQGLSRAAGARPQRLLWASTGAKDPAAPDTLRDAEITKIPF